MAKPKLRPDHQDEMGGIPEAQEGAAGPESPEAASASEQPEQQEQPEKRLAFAREKLARMEQTQRLCFRLQNDLPALAEELRVLKYSDFEVDQLLEPKGPRAIPGYL